jgi:peptidoglycan lytic transglycosylase G
MPLFRRSEPDRERTPEEREYARKLRNARRQGLPDPPRPGEHEDAVLPEVQPYEEDPAAEPVERFEDVEAEPFAAAEPAADAERGIEEEHAVAPEEPEPEPDEDLTWTEPVRESREPEPEPEPPVDPSSVDPVGLRPTESTLDAEAPAGRRAPDPDATDIHDVPRTPPPLPASSAARPLPTPPRRRYSGPPPTRSPAGPPAKRRGRWVSRILAILALVVVAFVLWFLFSLFQPGKGDGHGAVSVTIPQGSTSRQVGNLLADRGVVSSGFFFDLRARISGKRDELKAGRFTLAQDMSYGAAIDKLIATPGAPPTVKVTLPEGLSRREIAPIVKKDGLTGSYLAASDEHAGFNPRRYGTPRSAKSLEGFLFPATYELRENQASSTNLVGQQLAAFQQNIDTVSMTKAKKKNLTTYDVLIIASMVEREAQVAKERPLIAAVIYNRLKDGMPLGIDATTRYELGQWSRPLRVSELQKDTPYNTRTRRGLPPTPIGNPGLASIKAAANPSSVGYLYYVVKPGTCGEHNFSSNDAQFQRDVAAYNAARDKNGGKAPTKC